MPSSSSSSSSCDGVAMIMPFYAMGSFLLLLLMMMMMMMMMSDAASLPMNGGASIGLDGHEHEHDGLSELSVLVVGDWGRQGAYNQTLVAKQMGVVGEKLNTDFVISTGDNFYHDGLTGVDDVAFELSFTNIYNASSLQKSWYTVLGNHDYRGDVLAQLDPRLKLRDPRWNCKRSYTISHSIKGCKNLVDFFFIDTSPFVDEYWVPNGEHQYDWRGVEPRELYLSNQIKKLNHSLRKSKAMWKIVVGHHPLRSVGVHGDTLELLNQIYPILKKNNIHLYINGHDHCLEHIKDDESDLHMFTSGGGSKAWGGLNENPNLFGLKLFYAGQGFMSLSVTPSSIKINFYDIFGNNIHMWKFVK